MNKSGVGTLPGQLGTEVLDAAAFSAVGDVDVRQIDGLPYVLLINTDSAGHTITVKFRGGVTRGGQIAVPINLPPNTVITLPTAVVASMNDAQANGNCYWALCDVDVNYSAPGLVSQGATGVPQTSTGAINVVQVGAISSDAQQLAPSSINAASAEAVATAGVANVVQRQTIQFNGCASGPLTTVANELTYVALKGHTSGIYYAVIFAGTGFAGEIQVQSGIAQERLDIVTRNQDTVAHAFAFAWQANGGS